MSFLIFSGIGTPECAGLGLLFQEGFLPLLVTLLGIGTALFSFGFGVARVGTVLVRCLVTLVSEVVVLFTEMIVVS